MVRWKRFTSIALTGALLFSGGLAKDTWSVRAAGDNTANSQALDSEAEIGKVYNIYKAFTEGNEIKLDNNKTEKVDPEFGTANVAVNSSLSPRVLELKYQGTEGGVGDAANNGKMLATFECNRLPKGDAALVAERWGNGENISENLSSFPIYESIDGGKTWGGGYDDKPGRGGNYLPVGYVQNQGAGNGVAGMRNCPELYEMPETVGDLKKGTIICAGNSIQPGSNGAAANVMDSDVTCLDLCVTEDLGRTWTYHSSILDPISGKCRLLYNTVWEPFFIVNDGKLYCFYSDEAIDNTTDQDISYVYYDGEKWSKKQQVIYTKGQRPGMAVVSQLDDGRYMLTFEYAGGNGSGYILSAKNDLTQWYKKDGTLASTVSQNDYTRVNNNGSPYNIKTSSGTIVYSNAALGPVWMNSGKAPDEAGNFWIPYNTGLGAAYNRQIKQLSNGRLLVTGGWNDDGIKCVQQEYSFDLDKISAIGGKITSGGKKTYMGYNNTPMFTWTGTGNHAESNQYYEFQETEPGVYCMVSTYNGKAVIAEGTTAGSQVNTAAKDTENTKQQWIFEPAGEEGWYYVKNKAAGLYLTTPRTKDGDKLDQRLTLESKRENSDSQIWNLDIQVNEFEETYTVTVDEAIENGTIAADKTEVKQGENVSFTITPAEGYEIESVTVNNQSVSEQVTINPETKAGTLTIAAEQDVLISASFRESVKAADKTELQAAYDAGAAIEKGTYTDESFNALQNALAEAKTALEDENATAEQVETALANLQNAVDCLVSIKADKTKLETWIAKMEAVLGGGQSFTEESRKNAEEKLAAAKAVYEKEDADVGEVDAAWFGLLNAFLSLDNGAEKSALEQAIAVAGGLLEKPETEADYTAESVQRVKDALGAAKAVYEKEYGQDVTVDEMQAEINEATNALIDAVTQLLEKDYGYLADLIRQAEEMLKREDRFTPASVENLKKALDEAKKVAEDTSASADEINAAYDGLYTAMAEIQLRGNKAELASVMEKAKEILENAKKYHPATLEGLKEAYDAAKEVYDDVNAVQPQITEAVVELIKQCMEARILGDVDMNESVDTADGALVLKYSKRLANLTDEQVLVGDVDGSGKTDQADAKRILEMAAEKIEEF